MNLQTLEAVAGHYAWLEGRLFEVLGGWVPSTPEPAVKVVLRTQSFEHAWHSELWAGLRRAGAVGDGGSGLAPVLDAMAEPVATAERLAGAYRVVLPALAAGYARIRQVAANPADGARNGPLLRVLTLVLADQEAALPAGERLLRGLGLTSAEESAAVAHGDRLAALLADFERARQQDGIELSESH